MDRKGAYNTVKETPGSDDSSGLDETVLERKIVYEGSIFKVEKRSVELPDGRVANRDIVINPGASAIVAVDEDMRVLMVRQFRQTAGRVLLEIPAGKLDPGETPEACALRELSEETGFTAANITKLFGLLVSPGFATQMEHIYLATGLSELAGEKDEDEFIELVRIPLADAADMVMRGEIDDAKTAVGILAAARAML